MPGMIFLDVTTLLLPADGDMWGVGTLEAEAALQERFNDTMAAGRAEQRRAFEKRVAGVLYWGRAFFVSREPALYASRTIFKPVINTSVLDARNQVLEVQRLLE